MKKINWQYAFGEILIVIIGITIAFSLNKCSESQKYKAQKQQYIYNLKEDIKVDKTHLEENLEAINTKISTLQKIIPHINTDSPEKLKLQSDLFNTFNLTPFQPKDITYQTMINSGDFKLFDDFELKAAIEEHYAVYESILKDYARQETIHKDYLGNYLINYADYDAMKQGAFGFKNEAVFKNILQSMMGSLYIKKQATERGIESCNNILKILD